MNLSNNKETAVGTSLRKRLEIRVIDTAEEIKRFNQLLDQEHYLGSTPPVGDFTAGGSFGRAMGLLYRLGFSGVCAQGSGSLDWVGCPEEKEMVKISHRTEAVFDFGFGA